jgi:nanoRNase/pAp phosphatase (c-di-AMP/oligoRNAs hydrolase)
MEKILEVLKGSKGKSVLILTHHNADPDAIGSAIALSEAFGQFGATARIGTVESVSTLSRKILDAVGKDVEIDPKLDSDILFLVDTSSPGQLSYFGEKVLESKSEKIILDHHSVQKDLAIKADHSFINPDACSSAEIVFELLKKGKIELSKDTAFPLLLGMITDTAHLRYASSETFKTIAEILEKYDFSYEKALDLLSTTPDISESIARLKAAQRLEMTRVGDFLVATSQIRSFEASAARAFIRLGADIAIVVAERENEVRISMRSKTAFAQKTGIHLGNDLAPELAKIIEGTGSGHVTAAGVNGKNGKRIKEALKYVVDYVQKAGGK